MVVVYVQVVGEQYPLEKAHSNKVQTYLPLHDLLAGLRPRGFQCSTLTINWKGVVAESSGKELATFNILRRSEFKVLAVRCMVGSFMIHRIHQRMTSTAQLSRREKAEHLLLLSRVTHRWVLCSVAREPKVRNTSWGWL